MKFKSLECFLKKSSDSRKEILTNEILQITTVENKIKMIINEIEEKAQFDYRPELQVFNYSLFVMNQHRFELNRLMEIPNSLKLRARLIYDKEYYSLFKKS